MLNFSKSKTLFILAFCFVAIYFSLPSLFFNASSFESKTDDSSYRIKINSFLKKILPNNKINLGLDLRGGSQLMLEVDFDYYINEQLHQLSVDLSDSFEKENIRTVLDIVDNKIIFNIDDDENQNNLAKKFIKKNSQNLSVSEDDG